MSTWRVYDNNEIPGPRIIAMGDGDTAQILQADLWATSCDNGPERMADSGSVQHVIAEGDAVDEALRRAAAAGRHEYIRAGLSMPVWRSGRLVWVEPNELKQFEADGHAATGGHEDAHGNRAV